MLHSLKIKARITCCASNSQENDRFSVTIQVHAKNLKIPRALTVQQGSRCAQAGRSAIHLYAERADRAQVSADSGWGAAEQLRFSLIN